MRTPAQTASLHDRVARMYTEQSLSSPAIADKLGLNPTYISRIISKRGLTKPNGTFWKGTRLNEARNERIKKLYLEGLTIAQVAGHIGGGFTPSGVACVLRSRGVPRRQSGSWSPARPKDYYAIRDYAQSIAHLVGTGPGTGVVDFARIKGIPPERLRAHCRALGIRAKRVGKSKLSLKDATAIKRQLVKGDTTFAALGDRYGVSTNTIWSIAMGRSWLDAPWPGGKLYQPKSKHAGKVRTDPNTPRQPEKKT